MRIQARSCLLLLQALAACSDSVAPADPAGSSGDGGSTSGTTEPHTNSSTTDPTANDTTDTNGTTSATGTTSTEDTSDTTDTIDTGGTTDATDSGGSESDSGGTDTGVVPICGDGVIDLDETCDDGGESATCNADCTAAACGDGVFNASAGELCDDGGESATCNVDCTVAVCGDGIFNASAGEACDGAGRTAACNVDCTLAACGDGQLNVLAGEVCDDGGESATCNADCSPASCGDGITNLSAGETCDDAGASVACDADCTAAECGDQLVNPLAGEACDGPELGGASCQTLGYLVGTLGCGGGCDYDVASCLSAPPAPVLALSFSQVKQFDFSWAPVDADYYQLLESAEPGDPYVQLGGDLVGESVSHEMPLHFRYDASYVLRACNDVGCTDSAAVDVIGSLAEAVGYLKASNTSASDGFGTSVALSGDGNTLAIGAPNEDSNATGINGDQASDTAANSGAVYVFVRDPLGQWSQQAYVKANNVRQIPVFNPSDLFGSAVALSHDGSTLVVGAPYEDSSATAISVGGSQFNNGSLDSGAVYVFDRDALQQWSQQAYIKAFNNSPSDWFGSAVAISGDGSTLAVGAYGEDSTGTGINSNLTQGGASASGAVYVYAREPMQQWAQQAYVKASNTGSGGPFNPSDFFGWSVALSFDGSTLAVGALLENNGGTGIDANQYLGGASLSGAAYVFVRNAMDVWSQQAYVKASNTGAGDRFGQSVALSDDGDTLAVSAIWERSSATGIDGNQANDGAVDAGAAYVFTRDVTEHWSQQAYVKASNTDASDNFGASVSLSGDGNTLAVGAFAEDGNSPGVEGDQASNLASGSGAAYVYRRDALQQWSQQAYVKAPNVGASDAFGAQVALGDDGGVLAVGAAAERSNATGIGGDQANDALLGAGAVYLY